MKPANPASRIVQTNRFLIIFSTNLGVDLINHRPDGKRFNQTRGGRVVCRNTSQLQTEMQESQGDRLESRQLGKSKYSRVRQSEYKSTYRTALFAESGRVR